MVPEFQAEWALIMAQRAQQTGRISMRHAVSLDVHVETSCRNIGYMKVNAVNDDASLSNDENYLLWYGPGPGRLGLMGWVRSVSSNQNCPE